MVTEHGSVLAAPPLLEALPDAVVVADAGGRILYANAALTVLLGHDPAQLVGHPLTQLMPDRLRSAHAAGFARFLTTGRGELIGGTTQVPALHASGHEIAVDLTLSPLDPAAEDGIPGGVVVGVLRDASTTVLLERQLQVSRYLAATLRVTTALTEAADADVAFRRLLPTLCDQLDWAAAALWKVDVALGRLVYAGTWEAAGEAVTELCRETPGRSFGRGEGLPGLAWQQRAPVVIDDLARDPRFLRSAAARADGIRTGVAFPVLRGDTVLAICELFAREARPVPAELLEVLASAGRQIGQFLGRLGAESEVRDLAETLQRSLLPSQLPSIPGVELAARYRAGGSGALVGGDTYDVMPLPDGSWMLLIADVCGKGAEAAAMTAVTRHTARAAAADGSPGHVLAAVNKALLHEQGDDPLRFVTACCLVLCPHESGATLRVGVAGHPRPVLVGADGRLVEVGDRAGPLGISDDVSYPVVDVDVPRGTTLVLYTDGVTEARDDSGQQFGETGLARALSRSAHLGPEAMVRALTEAVERHRIGSRYCTDDLAVLAVRC